MYIQFKCYTSIFPFKRYFKLKSNTCTSVQRSELVGVKPVCDVHVVLHVQIKDTTITACVAGQRMWCSRCINTCTALLYKYAFMAMLVECLTTNPGVPGSIPGSDGYVSHRNIRLHLAPNVGRCTIVPVTIVTSSAQVFNYEQH